MTRSNVSDLLWGAAVGLGISAVGAVVIMTLKYFSYSSLMTSSLDFYPNI